MSKQTTTPTMGELQAKVDELTAKRDAAPPKARGIYTVKIRKAQAAIDQITRAAAEQVKREIESPEFAAAVEEMDAKMAELERNVEADATVAHHAAGQTKPASNVWQARVDAAVAELDAPDVTVGFVYTCPTAKTATGAATKLRKLISDGSVFVKAGLRVKSRGAHVVVVQP